MAKANRLMTDVAIPGTRSERPCGATSSLEVGSPRAPKWISCDVCASHFVVDAHGVGQLTRAPE
jgi:hypothetical protein